MSDPIEEARELVQELADDFVDGGREAVQPFLEGMAQDLEQIWTVPPERQARFLERMERQALAMPELVRLIFIGTTRETFTRSIIIAIRFALRVIA